VAITLDDLRRHAVARSLFKARSLPQALARLGFPLRPASARICHWQPYLRPGVFALYRALLARSLGQGQIRAQLRACASQPTAGALAGLPLGADAR
jgi:hypothetical protein